MQQRNTSIGARTRETILRTGADIASIEGLEGLSIGRLATELGMSKSGLFAHFGSKEDLQLAIVEAARQRYAHEVITPALNSDRGINRLHHLCESFLSYVERAVFPGGCFFAAAMAEFGARSPSPVRETIATCQDAWMKTLERSALVAQENGQLLSSSDPQQLVFELEAALLAANWYFYLYTDRTYLDRARHAVRARLASESTPAGLGALTAVTQEL